MTELSLNILDICQNSITAGADLIEIEIAEDTVKDVLSIKIKDNGCGMDEDFLSRVTDPFTTTRTTRKIGMGIPLFKMSAEMTGGSFEISSKKGAGTEIAAEYVYSSIDRMPLGDMRGTILTLVRLNNSINFCYQHRYNDKKFIFDTREIRKVLGGEISLSENEVIEWIGDFLKENYDYICGKADN